MNQNLEGQKFSDEEGSSGVRVGSALSSGNSPAVSLSGQFAQPSGSFSQPIGALSEFEKVAQEYHEIADLYNVGEPIGRGGCAVVLEAWRKSDNMHVVIKVIQISAGFDEKETHVAIARFMREAELIASLDEEHIVQCVDYGCFQGTPCMVLEFVDGLSLDKLIQKYGAIPLEFSAGIIRQLLSALVETHGQKIIHRDIKPGNIMVFDSPPPYVIRVLDFGISSVQDGLQSQTLMTQQGNVRGTPSYMAPELFTGETRASIESDLYAVGLVFYECLTGEIAFNDKSFMRVAYKQVNESLDIPGNIPSCIADIIYKLCEKKADDRYHSAEEVITDLDANIEKALSEEEKCLKDWEKGQKKRDKNKKKKRSTGMLVTQQGLFAGRHKVRNIIILALAVLAVIACIVGALYYSDQKLEDARHQDKDDIAAVKAQMEAEAKDKASEQSEEFKKKMQKITMDSAAKAVGYAWNGAIQKVETTEQVEKAQAEAEAKVEANKPAAPPKPSAPKKKANSGNGSSGKKPSSARVQDANVELPF